MPTVFIVGAGPSGLVALKEMREAGCAAYCVDAKPSSTRPCDLWGYAVLPGVDISCRAPLAMLTE